MLKKLFPKKVGGLIRFHGLTNWWLSLTDEERSKMKYYGAMGIARNSERIDTGKILSSGISQTFLSSIGAIAAHDKDLPFAEKILLKSLTVPDSNSIDTHFVYNYLIDLYYKQRSMRADALDLCVEYCLKDVKIIKKFLSAWQKQYDRDRPKSERILPRIPSFGRLAIIYGNEGRYDDAIKLCKKAIKLGLHDGTKGDFQGRITRLEKKRDSLS